MSWNIRSWLTGLGSFSSTSKRQFTKDEDGMYFTMMKTTAQFNNYGEIERKLEVVLRNPALLKVICLQCDLFSLGKFYVYQNNDGAKVELKNDPALDRLNNPNPFQGGADLAWDWMFWHMIGNAHTYLDSTVVTDSENKMYVLNTAKMEFPKFLQDNADKIVLSKKSITEIEKQVIKYKYDDGSTWQFPFKNLIISSDLGSSSGNWFNASSRIDALYKVICNSEETLDAANINIRYTGKFIVSGQADPNDVNKLPLGEQEATDMESKMNGYKRVHAMKSQIEIRRFIDDLKKLDLGRVYQDQYYIIGSMFGIPKDVLEAYDKSSTFENQEKSVGKHISYTLEPKGNRWMARIGKHWGYDEQNKEIVMSWDHLPFMQVFEKDRVAVQASKITTLKNMLALNISLQEANEFLDTNFKSAKYEQPKAPNGGGNQGNKGEKQD